MKRLIITFIAITYFGISGISFAASCNQKDVIHSAMKNIDPRVTDVKITALRGTEGKPQEFTYQGQAEKINYFSVKTSDAYSDDERDFIVGVVALDVEEEDDLCVIHNIELVDIHITI